MRGKLTTLTFYTHFQVLGTLPSWFEAIKIFSESYGIHLGKRTGIWISRIDIALDVANNIFPLSKMIKLENQEFKQEKTF